MSNLGAYAGKFTEGGGRVLQHAVEDAITQRQNYVSLWHILKALAREDAASFSAVTDRVGLNLELTQELIEKAAAGGPRHAGRGVRIAPEVIALFREAQEMAGMHQRGKIDVGDLLLVLANSIKLGPLWSNWYSTEDRL